MAQARIVFAGTPDFAVPALRSLIDSAAAVVAVYTQPDRRAGRGKKLKSSPVKLCALDAGIPVLQPESIKTAAACAELTALKPDLMVVAAYGQILPARILTVPRLGCINIHASLLPRWRGAAPIQRAIEAGDDETGVTLMQMAEGCDTGDMLAHRSIPIQAGDTTATMHDRLAQLGSELLADCLEDILSGRIPATPQDSSQATHAAKITRAEAWIDWHQPAEVIEHRMRAFQPWPGCHTRSGNEEIKLWRAEVLDDKPGEVEPGEVIDSDHESFIVACGKGALRVLEVQRPGHQRMDVATFMRGNPVGIGHRFSSQA